MLITDRVHPFPEKGQWWAHTNPLILHQVESPGGEITVFKTWHPLDGINLNSHVMPLNDEWSFLWFQGVLSKDYFQDEPLRTGDAFWNDRTGQVFLLGPIDREGFVTILADEFVNVELDHHKFKRLTQGPPDPGGDPPTAYDRILKEA